MVGHLVATALAAILVTGCALDLRGLGGATESADGASPPRGLGSQSSHDGGPVGTDAAGDDGATQDADPDAGGALDAAGTADGNSGNGDGGDGGRPGDDHQGS
jgi:hypothetical protein